MPTNVILDPFLPSPLLSMSLHQAPAESSLTRWIVAACLGVIVSCSSSPKSLSGALELLADEMPEGGLKQWFAELPGTPLEKSQRMKASFMLPLPPAAEVGMSWTTRQGTQTSTFRVVGEENGTLLIESESEFYQELLGARIITACLIDPSVDLQQSPEAGEPWPRNVIRAWVGLPGGKPLPNEVSFGFNVSEKEAAEASSARASTKTESLTLAGRKWDATVTENQSWTKSWSVGAFTLRLEVDGTVVSELQELGTGAEAVLDWSEVDLTQD